MLRRDKEKRSIATKRLSATVGRFYDADAYRRFLITRLLMHFLSLECHLATSSPTRPIPRMLQTEPISVPLVDTRSRATSQASLIEHDQVHLDKLR